MSKKNIRSRNWFLTLNNYSDKDIEDFKKLECKWICIAKEEAPTTGTKHLHICIAFEFQKCFSTLKKLFPRADIEKMKGTCAQARNYATKGNEILFENGTIPQGSSNISTTFKEMVQQAKEGSIDQESLMFCRYERFFRRFFPSDLTIYSGDLESKNAWLYGRTGTGKSSLVRNYAIARGYRVYNKLANKWWDNYTDQQVVLIEDLDPDSSRHLANHIKLWLDRYPFSAEFKGGIRDINPKQYFLIITSNYSIEECFNDRDRDAISRRCQQILMDGQGIF